MKQWTRNLCPSIIGIKYGNWGGKWNTHDKWAAAHPIDEGDAACRVHDFALREADKQKEPWSRKILRKQADERLWAAWKAWKPVKLWSQVYRGGILLVFKPRK